MRALVTGGAGFIGSHLVDALVADGHAVVVVDDLSSGSADHVRPEAELVVASVEDLASVTAAADGCDVVFHLAALRSVFRSVHAPVESNRINVEGTLSVLVAARDAGVRRVVNASSSSVYGVVDAVPTPESAPLVPCSPYAVSKLAGEHYCRVFAELYGLETVSLRYFNVYGPRQDPESTYAAVVPLFVSALLGGLRPVVHGDGRQTRDFTFVADVVAANLRAAAAPGARCAGRAFNIAGGDPWSLLEVLGALASELGVEADPLFTDPRAGDVRHTFADTSAARACLGHEPVVPMAEGLRRTVDGFLARNPAAARPGDGSVDSVVCRP